MKVTRPYCIFYLCNLLCLLSTFNIGMSSELFIQSVYIRRPENKSFSVDFVAQISMTQEQVQVLKNGIPLVFVYDVVLYEMAKWQLFRKEISHHSYYYKLTYNGLTQQYVVKNQEAESQDSYPTLSMALSNISEPNNIHFDTVIEKDTRYQGGVRLRLDIEALPTPLRIPAYLSKQWRLNSGWKYWEFE